MLTTMLLVLVNLQVEDIKKMDLMELEGNINWTILTEHKGKTNI